MISVMVGLGDFLQLSLPLAHPAGKVGVVIRVGASGSTLSGPLQQSHPDGLSKS